MIIRACIGTTILALCVSLPAGGQNLPPGKWWHRPEVIDSLGLSGQQRKQLDEILLVTAPELLGLKAEVEKNAIGLRAQLDRPSLDRDAIQRAAEDVSQARARLFERELMMLIDMRAVLEDRQWNRFRDLLEQRGSRGIQRRNPPGRRPGADPGRGPGSGSGPGRGPRH